MEKLFSKHYFGNREHFYSKKKTAALIPLHSHDYFELELVLDGEGRQILNGREYPLKKGSLYLLTPADFHMVELSAINTVWNIAFDRTMLSKNRLESVFSAKDMFRQLDESELSRLDRIISVVTEEDDNSEAVKSLFDYMLGYLFPNVSVTEERDPISRAILFMETYFREAPSLERTASEVGLSTVYFGNLFKSTVGETYISYLNKCRISCAKMLLKNGKSVTEACFDSGFGSLSGFLYTFKKTVGVTPEEYKSTIKK